MTMGFRNRRTPSNPRAGEFSPTTGRIVVGLASIVAIGLSVMMILSSTGGAFALALPLGGLSLFGLFAAVFRPELFE